MSELFLMCDTPRGRKECFQVEQVHIDIVIKYKGMLHLVHPSYRTIYDLLIAGF